MIVGAPKEIKPGEQRVALTPAGVRALVERGHRVLVEAGAGTGSGIRDDEYSSVGATLAAARELWAQAELVLKVKEPMPPEVKRLRSGQTLFTYLHLAADRALTRRAARRPTRSSSRTRPSSAPTAACPCSRR